jgi:syndecan 4
MNLQPLGCLVCLMIQSVASLSANYYYSGNGGFSNTCPTTACSTKVCDKGKYLKDCGAATPPAGSGAAPYAYEGVCTLCTLKPENSEYRDYTGITVALSDATCPYTCNPGFTPGNGGCVATACPTPAANSNQELIPGAGNTACNKQCKAGSSGTPAVNPSSCTLCPAGQYSAAGSTSCTPCATGSFAASTGTAACALCTALENGVLTYAAATGLSACTPCTATCPNGQFKSGCGGSNAGACTTCSN